MKSRRVRGRGKKSKNNDQNYYKKRKHKGCFSCPILMELFSPFSFTPSNKIFSSIYVPAWRRKKGMRWSIHIERLFCIGELRSTIDTILLWWMENIACPYKKRSIYNGEMPWVICNKRGITNKNKKTAENKEVRRLLLTDQGLYPPLVAHSNTSLPPQRSAFWPAMSQKKIVSCNLCSPDPPKTPGWHFGLLGLEVKKEA